MNFITLEWKEFSIPLDKLVKVLKTILSSNFDGLVCRPEDFDVMFFEEPNENDTDTLNEFWDEVTEEQFDPSLREIISAAINNASVFGRSVILDFAVENVEMGITQAGKTREVADYCADVQRYLESGSLYAAVNEIQELIDNEVPEELSPFITESRLEIYKSKIEEYLGI